MLSVWDHFFADKNLPEKVQRIRYGNMASIVGIIVNLLLSGFKLMVGIIAGSVAVIGDAINNLFDAASAVVSLITFRIIAKPADESHPFGHARFEYIASSIIAVLIIYVAITLFRESLERILHPSSIHLDTLQYFILSASIMIKLGLHLFYRRIGTKIASQLMLANATDALMDSLATGAIMIAVTLSPILHLPLDGPMGILIALVIVKQGWDILTATYDHLIGATPSRKAVDFLRTKLLSYDGVLGIHDMIIHEYGPNQLFVTVHVEVDARRDVLESHELIDRIERDITEAGFQITVHMDPLVIDDPRTNQIRHSIIEIIRHDHPDFSIHDFRIIDRSDGLNLIFDILIPVDYPQADAQVKRELIDLIRAKHKNFNPVITIDRDYLKNLE